MNKLEIPKSTFDPHPDGEHIGTIVEVIDQGLRETRFGQRHKITAIIESETASKDDGEPFSLWVWATLSSSSKATLTKLRQKLLRRPLAEEERRNFYPDSEMIGRKVRYVVEQNYGDDGQVFANLITWSPIEEAPAERMAPEQNQAQDGQGRDVPSEKVPAVGAPLPY